MGSSAALRFQSGKLLQFSTAFPHCSNHHNTITTALPHYHNGILPPIPSSTTTLAFAGVL